MSSLRGTAASLRAAAEQLDILAARTDEVRGDHSEGDLPAPDWLMVGVPVDNGRVRLYASKNPGGAKLGIVNRDWQPVWHVRGDLRNMIVITEDSYPECVAKLQEIWANEERESQRLKAISTARKAIGAERKAIPS